jgi:hypothetical protein
MKFVGAYNIFKLCYHYEDWRQIICVANVVAKQQSLPLDDNFQS